MGIGTLLAKVAVEGLAYHFDAVYSYKIPFEFEGKAVEGCRVMVPFGNGNRKKQGLILSVEPLLETENIGKLKSIISVLDKEPLFDKEMLSLVLWLKETTFCTLYEGAKAVLPAGIGLNYVVSYSVNEVSEEALDKLNDDELRVYNYLKDSSKYVKREMLDLLSFLLITVPIILKVLKIGMSLPFLLKNFSTIGSVGKLKKLVMPYLKLSTFASSCS